MELDTMPRTYARYIKLSFDGGAIGPNSPNKWMLDEVTVHGSIVPEPATFALASLALAGLGGYVRKRRKA